MTFCTIAEAREKAAKQRVEKTKVKLGSPQQHKVTGLNLSLTEECFDSLPHRC